MLGVSRGRAQPEEEFMTEGRKAARKRRARSVLMGFFVIAGLCSAVNSARGEIIVGWNFNTLEQGSKMLHADVGVGEISLGGLESDWEALDRSAQPGLPQDFSSFDIMCTEGPVQVTHERQAASSGEDAG